MSPTTWQECDTNKCNMEPEIEGGEVGATGITTATSDNKRQNSNSKGKDGIGSSAEHIGLTWQADP